MLPAEGEREVVLFSASDNADLKRASKTYVDSAGYARARASLQPKPFEREVHRSTKRPAPATSTSSAAAEEEYDYSLTYLPLFVPNRPSG